MQVALPLEHPIGKNVYGVAFLVLAGVAMLPWKFPNTAALVQNSSTAVLPAPRGEQIGFKLAHDFSLSMVHRPNRQENTPETDITETSTAEGQVFNDSNSSDEQTKEQINYKAQAFLGETKKSAGNGAVKDSIYLRTQVIEYALTWQGVPYQYGGQSRDGTDCSAFVQNVYLEFGISLPRSSYEQFRQGVGIPLSNLLPGDLLFFSTSGPGASHVGIYLGNRQFISATRRQVEIQSIDLPYWKNTYRGSRRILD